jgi:DNA polymerase III subunit epsilon
MRQIIFDTETTGLNHKEHRIVSLAAVEMQDGFLTGRFAHYHLNPERPCDPGAAALHGLKDDYLATQPKFTEIKGELLDFVGNSRFVIHNAPFDLNFFANELDRANVSTYHIDSTCTYKKAVERRGVGKGRNTLDTLARDYGVQNLREQTGKHGALVDCLVLYGVFRYLAGLTPVPLVQSQVDHFLNKLHGVHGPFEQSRPGGAPLQGGCVVPGEEGHRVEALAENPEGSGVARHVPRTDQVEAG